MGKVAKECIFLYEGFRAYVPKKKLADFDNEFLSKKSYSVKFMTELIIKYVNLKYYHKNPKNENDGYLFNFFLVDFSQRSSKTTKALKEFRNTPRTIDRSFMYFNAHPK
ncbi:hypothetical protein [Mangrovimonas sp. YM274]|uniref:hypothetical protein n=1 Tax=Mangrovimonas sp. YM274 TaxID=3070660 RepID=UPI0027DB7350|nr:hypothetical protein [Mangrovimonas sp. YM274]WMI69359.1 hypothetical protein RBH95_03045 [Mangrovimonas sp. YM274]